MNKRMMSLLARSLDGDLTAEERGALDAALAGSAELRREKERLVALRAAVASSRKDSFGPFFQAKVMERVRHDRLDAGGETFLGALARAFRPVAVAGAVAVAVLVVSNLAKSDDISVPAAFGISRAASQVIMESPVEAVLEGLS